MMALSSLQCAACQVPISAHLNATHGNYLDMELVCRRARSSQEMADAMNIRAIVFIGEQKVPADLERDGLDDQCLHFIAELNGQIIGTARVMLLDDKFKFQRVAVLPMARGAGVGGKLMQFMMEELAMRPDAKTKRFFLSSQVGAVPFYERLGFETCSDEYLDAGIQHRDMRQVV